MTRFADPRVSIVQQPELPLSGPALRELMCASLDKGAAFRFCARGWSMAPFIKDGDVITVAPLGGVAPRSGDVVAFLRPDSETLVVHRVVGRKGKAAIIRGDAVAGVPDGLIPAESILGRVSGIERAGRPVRLGLGPERVVIAWLSQVGLLIPLRAAARRWRRRLRRE